jgi:hypothetical protein
MGAGTIVAASSDGVADVFSAAFGIIMASMGLIVSFAAFKADERKPSKVVTAYPLFYAESKLEAYQERLKEKSGNRAFGFVLISMASFILTVSGVFGFFGSWPLTALGACCIIGGVVLCTKK